MIAEKSNQELRDDRALDYFQNIVEIITERKRILEKLRPYAVKAERSNRELQDFAQVASHHLQEPLRKILAFSDRIKANPTEVAVL